MKTPEYSEALFFHKTTDLLAWFDANYHTRLHLDRTTGNFDRIRASYAPVRNVQLILLVKYPATGRPRPICKIRCPINPLPIHGEFEVVSLSEICRLLTSFGWSLDRRVPMSLLK